MMHINVRIGELYSLGQLISELFVPNYWRAESLKREEGSLSMTPQFSDCEENKKVIL